jgi:hypothetical protein
MKKNNMIKSTKKKETMKKEITLKFYDNESHGYIKISKYDLEAFDIDIKIFSEYSYYNHDNNCYYFEEDCDASLLINELNNNGYKVNFDTKHVNCYYFDKPIFERINC